MKKIIVYNHEHTVDDAVAKRYEELMDNLREGYDKLLNSGMFFEIYPELTGNWKEDEEAYLAKSTNKR